MTVQIDRQKMTVYSMEGKSSGSDPQKGSCANLPPRKIYVEIFYVFYSRWFYVGRYLITSHQVDYMSSVLIPAEAVENDQEHLGEISDIR